MVLVTLDSLRSHARSLDERLRDIKKYPDNWIDSRINSGYEIISTEIQPFLKEEVIDLTEYIADGNFKFEVDFSEDIVGWKSAYYMRNGEYVYDFPVRTRFPTGTPVALQIKADNKAIVDIDRSIQLQDTHTITFEYYFFPNTKTGDQYLTTDIYQMVGYAIASSIYDSLRDYDKRNDSDNQLAKQLRKVVNGWDYDASNVRKGNWNV
jgi:hypothetical protein